MASNAAKDNHRPFNISLDENGRPAEAACRSVHGKRFDLISNDSVNLRRSQLHLTIGESLSEMQLSKRFSTHSLDEKAVITGVIEVINRLETQCGRITGEEMTQSYWKGKFRFYYERGDRNSPAAEKCLDAFNAPHGSQLYTNVTRTCRNQVLKRVGLNIVPAPSSARGRDILLYVQDFARVPDAQLYADYQQFYDTSYIRIRDDKAKEKRGFNEESIAEI